MRIDNQCRSQRSASARSLVFLVALLLAACGGGGSGGGTPANRGDLGSTQALGSATAAQIGTTASGFLPGYTATYDVSCQQLVYKTPDVDNSLLDASALLCLPQKSAGATSPLLVYDHGTIFADTEAPTAANSQSYFLAMAAASLGYATVMPDYIGYGASRTHYHPYLHAQTLASASVDAVRAARHYMQQQGIATNGKLFLSGYSEGGYAIFATQRAMERDFPREFTITASVPGAGPYHLSKTAGDVLGGTNLASAAFTAFVVSAYDTIYDKPTQLSRYFRAPYDTRAATAFDGSKTMTQVDALFTTVTADLFNDPFLTDFRQPAGETWLKGKLAENDLHDTWIPQSTTRLFHGVDDDIVPYANATDVLAHASGHDVQVENCGVSPSTHTNCGLPYWQYLITFFGSLDPGL